MNTKYRYMSRKELADKAEVSPRTMHQYLNTIWEELEHLGCERYKRLTPAGVKYICEHYGIDL